VGSKAWCHGSPSFGEACSGRFHRVRPHTKREYTRVLMGSQGNGRARAVPAVLDHTPVRASTRNRTPKTAIAAEQMTRIAR
jgi:hypothetical protein